MSVEPSITILPNFPDEGIVRIKVFFWQEQPEIPALEQFVVEISAAIPENDSVQTLRKAALTRAAAIMKTLAETI